jgi:Xaa-Pro aminopeptidase
MGGLGVSPAFPVGGSLKTLEAHEPILVDFLCVYHGYMVDTTRMFSIGKMENKWIAAYDAMRRVYETVLEDTRSGANCEELFRKSVRLAHELGYEDSYLGPPGLQTSFVAHGIGLELGEFPYLAEGHDYLLEAGMVFSLEPKVVFPGEGAVGVENTVVVTEDGYEVLTPVEVHPIGPPVRLTRWRCGLSAWRRGGRHLAEPPRGLCDSCEGVFRCRCVPDP